VAPEEILSAVAKANMLIWAKQVPLARWIPHWPTAIPAYEVAPAKRRGFIPSPDSPWQVPILTSAPSHPKNPTKKGHFLALKEKKGVSELLNERASCLAKASKAKMEKITRTHSLEWYKQLLNKELDEWGSRASVLVEGLRCPEEI